MDLRDKSPLYKLAISLVAVALSYLVLSHLVTPFFVHGQDSPLYGVFESEIATSSISIVSILLSLAIGLFAAHYLGLGQNAEKLVEPKKKSEADLKVLKKMMTGDEKKLVEEIEKSGEITQDSLRLRLDLSKAKVSTVLSILDRQGIVQKERSGKIYRVKLDPSVKKTV